MSVRRSAYFSIGSRNAGILINFAASVVIARLLTPAEIGVFAVSAAFVMVSQVIRDSGIGNYLIQERELTRQRLQAAMGVSLAAGGALGLLIFGLAGPLARFYGEPGIREVMLILVSSFVLAPVNGVGLALLRRELDFGAAFYVETASNLVWAGVAVVLAYLGAGYLSMAWASLAATVTMCLMFLLARRGLILIRPSLREWQRVFGFGSIVTLTHFVTQLGILAPALVLGRVADFGSVAFYTRGNSVTKMFRESVERGAAIVALPAFSAELRQGIFDTRSYCRATALITGISWPFFALLAIMAYPIVRILFGDQWDAAVPVVQLLAIANMIRCQEVFTPQLIIAHGAIRLALLREIFVQSIRIAVIVVCAFYGFVAVAAGQIAVTVLAVVINQLILQRLFGLTVGDRVRACRGSLLVTAASVIGPIAVAVLYPAAPGRLWPPLLLVLATGGAGWLAAVAATGHPVRDELAILFRKARSALAPGPA